jgi:hypothetical protein
VAYAKGKYALGLCDYCGQRFKLNELKKNWRGFKVCEADYEPKEPQLKPLRYRGDAIALFEPRPDRVEPLEIFVGLPGVGSYQSIGSADNDVNMQPYPEQVLVVAEGKVGKVVVLASSSIEPEGNESDLSSGNVDIQSTNFLDQSGVEAEAFVQSVSVTIT